MKTGKHRLACVAAFSCLALQAGGLAQPFGDAPLVFEPNRGQWDSSMAAFGTHADGFSALFAGAEVTYLLGGSATVKTHWVGAAASLKTATAIDLLPGTANYYAGKDGSRWISGVPTFGRLRMPDIYSGIDIVYYGNRNQLEFDLVVAPGADVAKAELAFEGGEVRVDQHGNLIVESAAGVFVQHKPVAYQESDGIRTPVEARYVLDKGTARFALGKYDHSRTLVIDPTIAWVTTLAANNDGLGYAVAVDGSGNVFLSGQTRATNFPGATGTPSGPGAFLTKMSSSGTVLYSVYYGGTLSTTASGVAVDSSGNAYITGVTMATDLPTKNAYQAALRGTQDAFVAKFSPTGTLLYGTYLGGSLRDAANGIAVDSSANIYVVGTTDSVDFPTASAYQSGRNSTTFDAFVTKLSADGTSLIFSTYLGGGSADSASAIALGPSGTVYVTGTTASLDFPTTSNAFQTTAVSGAAFVTRLAASGASLLYSSYLGGVGTQVLPAPQQKLTYGTAIDVDSTGAAFVTGYTNGALPLKNPIQSAPGDSITSIPTTAFVSKVSPDGTALVYSTYLGGSVVDQGFGIRVDSSGNATVVGFTDSRDFPTVAAFRPQCPPPNGFVSTLNSTGSAVVFSSCLSAIETDSVAGLALDAAANIYIAGTTSVTDFLNGHAGGLFSPFVVKLSGAISSVPVTFTTIPAGLQVTVDGAAVTTPRTLQWAPGVAHSLDVVTPQYPNGSAGNNFLSWSQGGAKAQTVTTPAAAANYTANFDSSTCTYTLGTPTQSTFGQAGGSGSVAVTSAGACSWTATISASWITPAQGSGLGSGTVSFTVALNPTGGTRTGTITVGSASVTITQTNVTPTVVNVTGCSPAAGVIAACPSTTTIQYTVNDADGANDLTVSNLLINSALDGRQACYLAYDHPNKVLYLVNDAGTTISGISFNSAGQGIGLLSNSQCTVDGSKTSVSTLAGSTQSTVTIGLIFAAGFAGNKVEYVAARDKEGMNSGWVALGVYRVSGGAVTYPNVVEAGYAGIPFHVTYQDSTDNANLSPSQLLINTSLDGRNACYVGYDHANNVLYLVNDAGDALLPGIELGTTATTQNSQCKIDGATSGYILSGRNYILYLVIRFLPGFQGPKIAWAATQTLKGANSDWQAVSAFVAVPQ